MGNEGFGLLNMFMRLQERFGISLAIGVTSIVGLIIIALPLAAYYLKTRIDLMRQDQTARENERIREGQERDKERDARDRERQAMLAELGETRAEMQSVLAGRLKSEREDAEKISAGIASALQEICSTLSAVRDELHSVREDGSRRSGDLHAKLELMHREIVSRKAPNGPIA